MRKCPKCGNESNIIGWSGWVVKAEGRAVFDSNGRIANSGTAKVISAVKQGQELDAPYLNWWCTVCGYTTNNIDNFEVVVETSPQNDPQNLVPDEVTFSGGF